MKNRRKQILKGIKDDKMRDKRGPVTFSLNLALYTRFKQACDKDGEPASVVIEQFIKEYLQEVK